MISLFLFKLHEFMMWFVVALLLLVLLLLFRCMESEELDEQDSEFDDISELNEFVLMYELDEEFENVFLLLLFNKASLLFANADADLLFI
jgi:hypothetical protein